MARPKPLPPPMTKCPLCDRDIQVILLDKHERLHIKVLSDSRGEKNGGPFRDEFPQGRAQMVVCRLTDSVDGYYVDFQQFFPRAILKVAELFPPDAHVQYLAETYLGDGLHAIHTILVIARF